MFSTHWDYAIVACLLCLVIYKYVEWKGAKKEWGDGIRGLALTTAQYSLMKIEDKEPHPKNWRPQLLLLLSMQWSKEIIDVRYLNLLNLASQLKAGKGLTVVTAFLKVCLLTRLHFWTHNNHIFREIPQVLMTRRKENKSKHAWTSI